MESQLYVKDIDELYRKMNEADDQPIVTLTNGETISLKNTLKFDTYISDDDYAGYMQVRQEADSGSSGQRQFKWWYVVLPFLVCCICNATCGFICLANRRRKIT